MEKHYIVWTFKGWEDVFCKECNLNHSGLVVPEMFKSKKALSRYLRTDDLSLIKKVKITIEEL